jgi:hypothetical protein
MSTIKNGKNPTRRQKEAIEAAGFNPNNWFVSKFESNQMLLIHRSTGSTKVIAL